MLALLNPTGQPLRETIHPVRAAGIDLGTTNSTIAEATWNPETPGDLVLRCLEVDQPTPSGVYTHTLVPSAIALHQGTEWIGEGARRLHARAPEFGLEVFRNLFLETKNDIGAKRTYHKAPEGYRSAPEVAARLLSFLHRAATAHDPTPIRRTVVTVPASFQASQRIDTLRAAERAGLTLSGGDLLDEPLAAFLDYLLSHLRELRDLLDRPRHLLVFDFGGGTCDVAIFQLGRPLAGGAPEIHPLAVSRYHRLGGGDIDKAILFDILLPQLLEQNALTEHDLSFEDKRHSIQPALLGVAESLKIGLCNEVTRLRGFAPDTTSPTPAVTRTQPGTYPCRVGDRLLSLTNPSLTAEQFDQVLLPFLDTDLLYARETEYRLTCSIFAPLQDALDRCGLTADRIDLALMVGGSSQIPQVRDAVAGFFPKARPLVFHDPEQLQLAVARGAAAHALSLALYGHALFQVTAPDRLALRTSQGAFELFPKGTRLPFPSDGSWHRSAALAVPQSSLVHPVDLRIEIIGGQGPAERTLLTTLWQIPPPVQHGDRVALAFRMDENQVLHLRLELVDRPDAAPYTGTIENPLTNVVNPQARLLAIQEAEETLRTSPVDASTPFKIAEIASGYHDLGQSEKAVSYLKQSLRLLNRPHGGLLNQLGICHGRLGDVARQEKCYLEAAAAGAGAASLFNLALARKARGRHREARGAITDCRVARDDDAPSLTLAAQIEEALGKHDARNALLAKALTRFEDPASLDDWELGWLITASRMAKDQERLAAAEEEKRRRAHASATAASTTGLLPEIAPALQPFMP